MRRRGKEKDEESDSGIVTATLREATNTAARVGIDAAFYFLLMILAFVALGAGASQITIAILSAIFVVGWKRHPLS